MFQEHMPNCSLRRVNIMSYNDKRDVYTAAKGHANGFQLGCAEGEKKDGINNKTVAPIGVAVLLTISNQGNIHAHAYYKVQKKGEPELKQMQ